jgi:hypothetical protein
MSELIKDEVVKDEPVINPELEAIKAQIKKMEESNARLLEESKGYKAKYQGLKSEVEGNEKTKLTENEQWKELNEIKENEIHQLTERLKLTETKALKKDLNFKVASIAKDAHDVNDIISALPKEFLKVDDENQTIDGVEEAINAVRTNKPWLFNTEKKSGMTSQRPVVDTTEDLDTRSNEDKLSEALGDLFA